MAATNLASEKSFVFDFIDRNEAAVATIGDSVFYFGELGMQEVESAKLMTGLLEEAGSCGSKPAGTHVTLPIPPRLTTRTGLSGRPKSRPWA